MIKRIMPPTYFLILLAASIALHFIFPVTTIMKSPYSYPGLALIVFGIAINLWTDSIFKRHKTTVKPHEMPESFVDSGPFRISRHPMYLGMESILLGAAVFMGSLSPFVAPITFILLMESMFIPLEENNMEKRFSRRYSAYKNKVRRWV